MDLFPFPEKREKQGEMMEEVRSAFKRNGSLIVHAPTGLGKTAASITPLLEETLESDEKVFFLTPRHSQHKIALETAEKISEEKNVKVNTVDLIGRDHLCEADAAARGGQGPDCPRHDNTFTDNHELSGKAKRKIRELRSKALTAEEVRKRCKKVCPYQVSLHMAEDADLIVADYFHIFHPAVRDIVFEKAGIELEDSAIIVDEAHNLSSRTRSLFTEKLSIPNIDRAITETEKFGFYQEQENLEQLKKEVQRLAQEELGQETHEEEIDKKALKQPVDSFYSFEELIVDLEAAAEEVHEEKEQSYCSGIAEFLEAWKGRDKGFVRCIRRAFDDSGGRRIEIKYSCLDPQISTEKPLNSSKASVLMSGTLTPPSMYVDLLGINEAANRTLEFESPFPSENKMELVIPTVTTKYEERDESMKQKYAWYLAKSFEAVEGNCAVFFPSYQFMYQIKDELKKHTDREIFTEDRSLGKEEKQEVLDRFAKTAERGNSVLLGVAAGSFGEGIDYPGEKLKAVFIVGLPLQRPDLETKALIDFLDAKFDRGWDYGYSFPAMNRAIQAAGRCIRSKNDKGVIVYMDKRYSWSNYRKVFPPDINLKESRAPWKEIEEFFQNQKT
ncbi:MAG: ATP-dependent DNA helicase [Candidatus Nanohalobium sp.]